MVNEHNHIVGRLIDLLVMVNIDMPLNYLLKTMFGITKDFVIVNY